VKKLLLTSVPKGQVDFQSLRKKSESLKILIVTLTYKILQNPLDKIFDYLPGGSADFEPRDGGVTKELKFCLQIYGDSVSFVLVVFQIAEYENRRI